MRTAGTASAIVGTQGVVYALPARLDRVPQPSVQALLKEGREPADFRVGVAVRVEDERQ